MRDKLTENQIDICEHIAERVSFVQYSQVVHAFRSNRWDKLVEARIRAVERYNTRLRAQDRTDFIAVPDYDETMKLITRVREQH